MPTTLGELIKSNTLKRVTYSKHARVKQNVLINNTSLVSMNGGHTRNLLVKFDTSSIFPWEMGLEFTSRFGVGRNVYEKGTPTPRRQGNKLDQNLTPQDWVTCKL